MVSIEEPVDPEKTSLRWRWLFKVGGMAAWVLLALFAIGITGVGALNGRYAFLQNNWLIVLFKLNVRFYEAQTSMLNAFNILDLAIMVLFCLLFLALHAALHRSHKIWLAIATSLPFLGIVLFLITHTLLAHYEPDGVKIKFGSPSCPVSYAMQSLKQILKVADSYEHELPAAPKSIR